MAARMAMMAMTTNNSMRVNAARFPTNGIAELFIITLFRPDVPIIASNRR
jgi:hypothetical protein